jgi:hypothetical protein
MNGTPEAERILAIESSRDETAAVVEDGERAFFEFLIIE